MYINTGSVRIAVSGVEAGRDLYSTLVLSMTKELLQKSWSASHRQNDDDSSGARISNKHVHVPCTSIPTNVHVKVIFQQAARVGYFLIDVFAFTSDGLTAVSIGVG